MLPVPKFTLRTIFNTEGSFGKGAAKASCGETVVQKGVFGESVSSLPPLRFALKTHETLRGQRKRTLQKHPFRRPFLRTTPSPLLWRAPTLLGISENPQANSKRNSKLTKGVWRAGKAHNGSLSKAPAILEMLHHSKCTTRSNLLSHSDLLSRRTLCRHHFPGNCRHFSSQRRVHSVVTLGGGGVVKTLRRSNSLPRSVFSTAGSFGKGG